MSKYRKYPSMIKFTVVLIITLIACACSHDLTGTRVTTVVEGLEFNILDRVVRLNTLTVSGSVRNNGESIIPAPWFFLTDLFSDSTLTHHLGEEEARMDYPLGPQEEVGWQVVFSAPHLPESEYPDFVVEVTSVYFVE